MAPKTRNRLSSRGTQPLPRSALKFYTRHEMPSQKDLTVPTKNCDLAYDPMQPQKWTNNLAYFGAAPANGDTHRKKLYLMMQ